MISPILFLQLILQLTVALQAFNQPKILSTDQKGGPHFSTDVLMLSIYNHGFGNLGTLPQLGYTTAQVWVLFVIILVFTIFTFRFSSGKFHSGAVGNSFSAIVPQLHDYHCTVSLWRRDNCYDGRLCAGAYTLSREK